MARPTRAQAAKASTLAALVLLWSCSPPAALPRDPGSKGSRPKTTASRTVERATTPQPPGSSSSPVALPTLDLPLPEMEPATPEVAAMARQLTAGKPGQRAKALALYEWIAQNVRYDMVGFLAGEYPDPSPDLVLSTRSAVCEGYARLFSAMAQEVGLEAVMVPGYSKGFAPGESHDKPDHAWNAVKIDGVWQLLDVTWGSGHIDAGQTFVAEYGTEWFEVPADQFIYSHLPEEPRWQLLDPTVAASTFWEQPSVSPLYFDYGLKLLTHPQGLILSNGPLEVELSSAKDCRIMATLEREGAKLEGDYTMVERHGNEFKIFVSTPGPGSYRLIVFCGPPSELRTESAVVYQIQAGGGQGAPFPKTLKTFTDEEVRLVSPRGALRRGQAVQLVLDAPDASKMMAVIGEQEVAFEKSGDRFVAEVIPDGKTVTVYGSYDDSTRYNGLLEYPVAP